MLSTTLLSFISALLLISMSPVGAAPVSISSQVEILRISGVNEREIEQTLNPNHFLASAHESTIPSSARTIFQAPQQYLLAALSSPSEAEFAATIDGYSTARSSGLSSPASASLGNLAFEELADDSSSLGAFERVRRWMSRRAGGGPEDGLIVTGRLGDLKIRGRR